MGCVSISTCCPLFASTPSRISVIRGIPLNHRRKIVSALTPSSSSLAENRRKLPVFLFDIMGTIVKDPFYENVPAFFGLSMGELMKEKHPTAWSEFEKGEILEDDFARKFFIDGRTFDYDGFKHCMRDGYAYIDGMKDILERLKTTGYEMHAFTNYPCWYMMIEEKLQLSRYMSWNFCSCKLGRRKPEKEIYMEALEHLRVLPTNCIFIDDRWENVEAASELGILGIKFENATKLEHDFIARGVKLERNP
eukprot:TRINITY_DN9092_c0_g1_i1.p1 TRINITY_DN9092_c0_g1~~TRINITY_DN9092_c0_g1_i1.p1  ORF type:complete len:250 (+),score=48.90 TRINITY_DN9092_c0_g1_i1:208-957(+)